MENLNSTNDFWHPGECHAHIFMNGTDYQAAVDAHSVKPNENLIRQTLEEYRRRGITFIREGGDHYGVSLLAKQIAPEYGITYLSPVSAIYCGGHYGRVVGVPFSDMREFAALVRKNAALGADFVKIMTTGIMDFITPDGVTGERLPAETVREMVHIAHEEGFRVMSHTNGVRAVIEAAEAGVDSIEHANFQNEESLQCLRDCGTVYVPTVVTVRNLLKDDRFSHDVISAIWEGIEENIRYARRIGVCMALGSDAGAYRVLHGQGIEDEYRAFHDILPEDDTLDAALQEGESRIRRFTRQS